jgi:hypothetical protein
MGGFVGPTANLPGTRRRIGRSGTVWIEGKMRGEITSIEWEVQVERVKVQRPGTYQDEDKPGAETRDCTIRFQDIDDYFRRLVWGFLEARRRGDRAAAAQFPELNILTVIDDIGAPAPSRWALRGVQLFSYSGGFSQDDDILTRDVPASFREDGPVDTFEYTDAGVVLHSD